MIPSILQAAVAPVVQAAQTEAEFYQGQPITWALLGVIGVLGSGMYLDLKRSIDRLWHHGHSLKVECSNDKCHASADTEGVVTKEGG